MVSCGPAPPPQCSWFSSREREEGELRLNPMPGCRNHLRSRVPGWINRHSVAWVRLEREEAANLASKTSYRPSDTGQCGLFWDGGCRRDGEAARASHSCPRVRRQTATRANLWVWSGAVCVTGPGHTHASPVTTAAEATATLTFEVQIGICSSGELANTEH